MNTCSLRNPIPIPLWSISAANQASVWTASFSVKFSPYTSRSANVSAPATDTVTITPMPPPPQRPPLPLQPSHNRSRHSSLTSKWIYWRKSSRDWYGYTRTNKNKWASSWDSHSWLDPTGNRWSWYLIDPMCNQSARSMQMILLR